MSNNPVSNIGFCGKIPCKGDFIQNNLSDDFLKHWNEWLQAVLAVSKEQLEDDWLNCYLTSPIWHFSLSPGICSDSAVLGTIIPSIDQVNRHFPFTLAFEHKHSALDAWYQNTWSEKFNETILAVLEDEFELDTWCLQLNDYVIDLFEPSSATENYESEDKLKKAWVIKGQFSPKLVDLLHQQYTHHYGRYSLWWTLGSALVEPCLIVTEGLPQVGQFAAMLNGQWQENNWNISKIKD